MTVLELLVIAIGGLVVGFFIGVGIGMTILWLLDR